MTNTITVTSAVLKGIEGDQDLFFNIEWTTEEGEVVTEQIAEETMDNLIQQGLTSWVCVDEDALAHFTRVIKSNDIKYYTLDDDADGSGEHDLYVHKAFVEDGEVKYNVGGELIKTYKRLSYARKALAELQA